MNGNTPPSSETPSRFSAAQDGNHPLKILIAGAGIGGLYTAISLAQQGHRVTIYESSRFALETGAAIHLPPNVNCLLRRYSILPEEHGAVTCEWVSQYRPDGSVVFENDVRKVGEGKVFGFPWQLVHRIDLHNALKQAAKEAGVEIKLQSKVKGADCEKPSLTLESGEVVVGDLVIGADGVHSVLRKDVIAQPSTPYASGSSAFRFLIPTSVIKSNPETALFALRTGEMKMIFGDERRIVMYPCRDNTEINFVAMVPDHELEGSEGQGWNQTGSKEVLLKLFDGWAESFKTLLQMAPEETVKLWKLLDCEVLPNWTKSRVALIGDAAHPFLPHQGQGGAQAMEDGAALGALLPLGTLPEEIPERLALFFECRHERATTIQVYSRDSGMKIKGIEHVKKEGGMDPLEFMAYNFRHDAFQNAKEALSRH